MVPRTAAPSPSQSACTLAGIWMGVPMGTQELEESETSSVTSPLPTPAATGTTTVERDCGSTVA